MLKGLSRWHRIALVRELSSAAVKDGEAKGARFARAQRLSAVELQQHFQEKAQQIFARQVSLELTWPMMINPIVRIGLLSEVDQGLLKGRQTGDGPLIACFQLTSPAALGLLS